MPLASLLCPKDVVLDSVVWAEVRPWPHFPLSWGRPGASWRLLEAVSESRGRNFGDSGGDFGISGGHFGGSGDYF